MKRISHILIMLMLVTVRTVQAQHFLFPSAVAPLITTAWGQGNPYNLLCPVTPSDSSRHTMAGCGPIVMSQVIRYYQYPHRNKILGSRYDFPSMFETNSDTLTHNQKLAVAQLISDCGKAGGTRYGTTGSSTVTKHLTMALERYFNYSRYMHIIERKYFTGEEGDKAWKNILYAELSAGRPVFYRGIKKQRMAHVFIIDGCKDSLVHVNWGWYGLRNGYYDLDSLYGYNTDQQMAIEIAPEGYLPNIRNITTLRAGTLHLYIKPSDWYLTHHLKISGILDKKDIALLRQLAGGGKNGEPNGNLSTLDLSSSTIKELPDSAFYGCKNLSNIILPMTLLEISKYAFAYCITLNHVKMFSLLRNIRSRAFFGCQSLMDINLPPSLQRIDNNAFNSCNFVYTVRIPANVRTIGSGAFANMASLSSLYIPRNIPHITRYILTGSKNARIIRR